MTGDPWLSALLPASVALPLLVAALMVTFASLMPRLLRDAIMLATTLASVGASIWLLIETTSGLPVADWLSGGSPRNGVVPGIALYVDSPAAAVLSVVGLIFVAVTIYAWRYFKVLEEYFHTMLLVLLGAMTALVMAADLFTMFVAFELMSVIAYALTAFNVEDEDALAGAFNFAILGSIATLLMMVGIAAIYAGTGALNLAAISRTLAGQSSPLASIGLAMVVGGLLLKLAAAPLQFWIADAETASPSPVAALSSGAMTTVAAFWLARLMGVVVGPMAGGVGGGFSGLFIGLGVVTLWVGALLAIVQIDFKRLLAFSTVSHMGVALIAIGLMGSGAGEGALAGAGLYVLSQGLVKAALFLLAGVLMHRFGTVDLRELRTRIDGSFWVALPILAGGLALAGCPPFGLWPGKLMIEHALPAGRAGDWLFVSLVASAVLTGGAVLHAVLHAFLGFGPAPEGPPVPRGKRERFDPMADEQEDLRMADARRAAETEPHVIARIPPTLILAPVGLLLAAAALPFVPEIIGHAHQFAAALLDGRAYQAAILDGDMTTRPLRSEALPEVATSLKIAAATLLVPIGWQVVRLPWPPGVRRFVVWPIAKLRLAHDGTINDYVLWLVAGFTLLMAVVMWKA